MSEKEKPKRSTRMGFLRSCLIFSLYPLLIFAVLGIGFVYWAIGGYVKPSLDLEYLLAAAHLYEYPIGQGDGFEFIWLVPNDFENNQICFYVYGSSLEDFDNLRWTEVYINEQVVSRFHWDWPQFPMHDLGYYDYVCLNGHLESGFHIIEFRVKTSFFAEPYYIRRWGEYVE